MTSGPTNGLIRWRMLAIICLGFFALTLNWFDAAAAFGPIAAEFHSSLSDLTLLASLFFVGYGIAHVPGGMLATRIGMKKALVIGLVIQGIAGVMSGLSYSYNELAVFRVVSGLGGSIFIAVAFGAVMVWFKDRDVTVALGVSGGAAFSGGAAIALFIWVYLQNGIGWHGALWIAGVMELIIAGITAAFFEVPAGGAERLTGVAFEWTGLVQAIRSRDLWIYGIAFLGGYGAYFTVSQLFTTYAVATRGFPVHEASLLAAVITLAGIPGAIFGGVVADRVKNLKLLLGGSLFAAAILLVLIPHVGKDALWFVGFGVGFFVIFGFAAFTSVPERVVGIPHEHSGTAVGLMLTIAAVGGYFIPRIFGHVVPHHGYTYGWTLLAIIAGAFALFSVLARNATRTTATEILATQSTSSNELVSAQPTASPGVPAAH